MYQIQCSDPDKEDVPNLWYNMLPIEGPDACLDNDPFTACDIDHSTGWTSFLVLPSDASRGYVDVEYRCRDPPAGDVDAFIATYYIQ